MNNLDFEGTVIAAANRLGQVMNRASAQFTRGDHKGAADSIRAAAGELLAVADLIEGKGKAEPRH